MKYKRFFSLLVLALLSSMNSSCSNTPFNSNMGGTSETMAVLTGYQLSDGFVTIQTIGYGCTFFDSFKVVAHHERPNSLVIQQIKPDECNMGAHMVSLQYSFKHLDLDLDKQIKVVNPIGKPKALVGWPREIDVKGL